MKKLLKKMMICATMMAALVGFTSCEDDLDIQTNYPFKVEVMPVPTKVLRGQTVEIRCQLNKEGDYNFNYETKKDEEDETTDTGHPDIGGVSKGNAPKAALHGKAV